MCLVVADIVAIFMNLNTGKNEDYFSGSRYN